MLRDIPGLVWILSIFMVGVISLFLYSRTGPDPLASAESVWDQSRVIADLIKRRSLQLNPGEKRTLHDISSFQILVERLTDVEIPNPAARYTLEFTPKRDVPDYGFMKRSFRLGVLDFAPNAVVGNLQIVAIRKIDEVRE